MYSKLLRSAALLAVGPLGCSVLYYLIFVARQANPSRYPALAGYFELPLVGVDIALFVAVTGSSIWWLSRSDFRDFERNSSSLSTPVLAVLTACTAGLMALSVYRIFGTLDHATVMANYAKFYALSRRGGAWMILSGYGILYIFLADMFFGGVNRRNSFFFVTCIALNFITGGRGMLLVLVMMYLFLLYLQKPRVSAMLLTAIVCIGFAGVSYTAVSALRVQGTVEKKFDDKNYSPTTSVHALNYNAAFILNDVLTKIGSGEIKPGPYALNDLALLVPRFLNPNKPKSDAETWAVYPVMADRNITISFPLKANLVLHFGMLAFYLDWLAIAIFQLAFMWSASRRQTAPTLLAFIAFFWGCVFSEIARAGVMNYRVLLLTTILAVAFACYRVAPKKVPTK